MGQGRSSQDADEVLALSPSWERMFCAFEHAPVAMALMGVDGCYLEANRSMADLVGRQRAELRSTSFVDVTHPDDRDASTALIRDVIAGAGEGQELEKRYVRPDGTIVWGAMSATVARDDGGEALHVIVQVRDITRARAEGEARRAAHRELRGLVLDAIEAREFWGGALDSLPDQVAVLDECGTVIAVNEAWRAAGRGDGGGDCVGVSYLQVCDAAQDDLATAVGRGLREVIAGTRSSYAAEYPCHSPVERRWFAMRAVRYQGAGRGQVVVIHQDVTARRLAESASRVQAELLDRIDAAVIATDPEGRITAWNDAAERLYGWPADEVLGCDVVEVTVPPGSREDAATVLADLSDDGAWRGQLTLRRRDGSTFPGHVRDTVLRDERGVAIGYVGVSMDITERVAAEAALRDVRDHLEAVTGSMGEGLCTLDARGRITFRNPRALEMLGAGGADPLGTPLRRYVQPSPGTILLDRWLAGPQAPGTPFRLEDEVLICGDGSTLPVAITMTSLPSCSTSRWVVVMTDMTDRRMREAELREQIADHSWVERLRRAMDEERLVLHAQPIAALHGGDVVRHELLLRMHDPVEGLILPTAFIPSAERLGLMPVIDRWVVDRALAIAGRGIPVGINLSGGSLGDPELLGHVRDGMRRHRVDPSAVAFEVTETDLIRNLGAARQLLQGLRDLGCEIALDDFGTGYAGFTYLKSLAVDHLKIDRDFVSDLLTDDASRQVVMAVVGLARGLRLKTVAEGVEDAVTLAELRRMGVDHVQGHLVGHPAPIHHLPVDGRAAGRLGG